MATRRTPRASRADSSACCRMWARPLPCSSCRVARRATSASSGPKTRNEPARRHIRQRMRVRATLNHGEWLCQCK